MQEVFALVANLFIKKCHLMTLLLAVITPFLTEAPFARCFCQFAESLPIEAGIFLILVTLFFDVFANNLNRNATCCQQTETLIPEVFFP
jgi:hypothetical protein